MINSDSKKTPVSYFAHPTKRMQNWILAVTNKSVKIPESTSTKQKSAKSLKLEAIKQISSLSPPVNQYNFKPSSPVEIRNLKFPKPTEKDFSNILELQKYKLRNGKVQSLNGNSTPDSYTERVATWVDFASVAKLSKVNNSLKRKIRSLQTKSSNQNFYKSSLTTSIGGTQSSCNSPTLKFPKLFKF